jgi:hypothetical protein
MEVEDRGAATRPAVGVAVEHLRPAAGGLRLRDQPLGAGQGGVFADGLDADPDR